MKKIIVIIGTNCVGKSTLAKALIERFGGIREVTDQLTFCNDGKTALAGKYSDASKYGGVDGFNSTKVLESVARKGFETCDLVICEGSYLGSFGLNLTNAIFTAEKQLVVFLYASVETLHQRLTQRGKKGITTSVVKKQLQAVAAARKWNSIGVPVLVVDTSSTKMEKEIEMVLNEIETL